MKKLYLCLIVIGFIIVIALTTIYTTHKTCYLNLSFYGIDTTGASNVEYTKKTPSCIEVVGINIKHGKDILRITDKQTINSVIDYLNNVPLVTTVGYLDKSTRVFVIKELLDQGYDFIKGKNDKSGSLRFFNDNQIEIGSVMIYDGKYICDPNYRAYKVQNENVSIITELEKLLEKHRTQGDGSVVSIDKAE